MRNMVDVKHLWIFSTPVLSVDIQGGYVIRGALPSRQLKLILAWCELHKDELMQNWELARDAKPLNHVAPLI